MPEHILQLLEGKARELCGRPETEREMALCREVADLQRQVEALHYQSVRDPLTGLFNRRYMEESLEREFYTAHRNGTTVGIIMGDLDHFKKFNDTFGHAAGDLVLERVGSLIQAFTRKSDTACRYGGEEFLIILPRAPVKVACQRAERFREILKRLEMEHHDQKLGTLTISIGVAAFPEHGTTSSAVLRAADAALYKAKNSGRDRVLTP